MSVSAEMYIVISLMFAVFAAVAAVGSSIVLGAGFERLRAGFEIIRKQTGFFADAIHKLDQRTEELSAQTGKLQEAVSGMAVKVERVEKTTGFFSDAIHSLEQKILDGGFADSRQQKQTEHAVREEPLLPREISWITASESDAMMTGDGGLMDNMRSLMMPPKAEQEQQETSATEGQAAETRNAGLPNLLMSYFRDETRGGKEIVYH